VAIFNFLQEGQGKVDMNLAYVDLYLIHEPLAGAATRMAIWKALVDAKKAGKVKDIGVSNL
jgi:diketogulonate reductase-like aldo/keto reductase